VDDPIAAVNVSDAAVNDAATGVGVPAPDVNVGASPVDVAVARVTDAETDADESFGAVSVRATSGNDAAPSVIVPNALVFAS
jgi:hypothetical protein